MNACQTENKEYIWQFYAGLKKKNKKTEKKALNNE